MKNVFFWDVTPCGPCENRRFGGKYHFHLQGNRSRSRRDTIEVSETVGHRGGMVYLEFAYKA
jgi:hypothetical protein